MTLKLLVRFVAGVRPEYDGVWVQPPPTAPSELSRRRCPGEGRGGAHPVQADPGPGNVGLQWTASRGGRYNDILKAQRLWIPANRLKGTIEVTVED